MGLPSSIYWLANWLFDAAGMTCFAIFGIIIYRGTIYDSTTTVLFQSFSAWIILTCLASPLHAYVVSRYFSSHSKAQVFICISALLGTQNDGHHLLNLLLQLCFLLLSAFGLLMGACNAFLIVPFASMSEKSGPSSDPGGNSEPKLPCDTSCYPCNYKNNNYSFPTCSRNVTQPDQSINVSEC